MHQNMCPTDNLDSPADQGGLLDTDFEEMRFSGSW